MTLCVYKLSSRIKFCFILERPSMSGDPPLLPPARRARPILPPASAASATEATYVTYKARISLVDGFR